MPIDGQALGLSIIFLRWGWELFIPQPNLLPLEGFDFCTFHPFLPELGVCNLDFGSIPASMSQFIPLFPLNLVVYPGETLRLHIFEPRYRQLTHECIEENKGFGIPLVKDKQVSDIATEVKITKLDKTYASGEMDIITVGVRKFSILKFMRVAPGKLYPGGEISWLDDDMRGPMDSKEKVWSLVEELHQTLGIHRKVPPSAEDIRAYEVARDIGFSDEQKYDILSLNSEAERLTYIEEHLREIIPVVRQTERLKALAKLNGHFKNIIPPDF